MPLGTVKTRAAVFYADRLGDACRILCVNGTILRDAKIVSTGTYTKLRRRFKGAPVEEATKDRLLEYFWDRMDDRARARFAASFLDLDQILLPATWCLSDVACHYSGRVPPFRRSRMMKSDHVDTLQIDRMLRGHFAVRKHLYPVAQHIFNSCKEAGFDLRGLQSPDELLEEHWDHNSCFPVIYNQHRRIQSPLLDLRDPSSSVVDEPQATA
jgi:hypothetical protein